MHKVEHSFYRPTIAEIDLDAVTHNVHFFKERIPHSMTILAIVKADAYGHGAVPIVKHLQSIGIHYFAVAFIDEAIELRKAGIMDPILILGHTSISAVEKAFEYDITLTVFTKEIIKQIHLVGEKQKKKLKVHIKVDTGMGRIGVFPEEALTFFHELRKSPWIEIEGVFTHFATADEEDKTFTQKQYKTFMTVAEKMKSIQDIRFVHASNSAAMIDMPNLQQTMTRLGISLYGLLPSKNVKISNHHLKPVMSIKSKVVYLKKVFKGQSVSYGATFVAPRDTMVATIPIGYADGFSRGLSNKGFVLIRGEKAPVIGRVCMDQIMIDVTDIPLVQVDDEVVIYGTQNGLSIQMDDHAEQLGTINYELATLVGKRIPRIYLKDGQIDAVINNLWR